MKNANLQERKFVIGQRVTKTKGSSWTGKVVGFYSTDLTPVGYAVESETEKGSVQIYPESALESAQPPAVSKEAEDVAREIWNTCTERTPHGYYRDNQKAGVLIQAYADKKLARLERECASLQCTLHRLGYDLLGNPINRRS